MDSHEPISGYKGDTTKNEPYDLGNLEENTRSTTAVSGSDPSQPSVDDRTRPSASQVPTTHGPAIPAATTSQAPIISRDGINTTTNAYVPARQNKAPSSNFEGGAGTGVIGSVTDGSNDTHHNDFTSRPNPADGKAAAFSKSSGIAAGSESGKLSSGLKAGSASADTTAGQNDTRDPSDLKTSPGFASTDVDNTSRGPRQGKTVDGHGPRSVSELAKERGGDAGNVSSSGHDHAEKTTTGASSHDEGTGEKYIKSTGLQADGGDFDAARAGAGKEADRLLEAKGIHRDKPADVTGSHAGDAKEKKGPLDAIKDKLHMH